MPCSQSLRIILHDPRNPRVAPSSVRISSGQHKRLFTAVAFKEIFKKHIELRPSKRAEHAQDQTPSSDNHNGAEGCVQVNHEGMYYKSSFSRGVNSPNVCITDMG
ncbi:hypothetical protein N7G274_008439 [Stereocaulon virgatum]|uniref:Uncharacterized protein n=1 Tax=Stereocaulon virgatum TaxID=373712 RepID=A0ABR4A079_9LECA